MFVSYQYIKYLGYDAKKNEDSWQYKIIDSDFGEEVVVMHPQNDASMGLGVGVAVIDTYEKRKLNVAANLMKAFIWYSKKYGHSTEELISRNKKYNPKFAKYEKDIEKYMVLI